MLNEKMLSDPDDLMFFIKLIEEHQSAMIRRAQIMITGRYTSYIDDALQDAYISIAKNIFTVKARVACNKRRAFCVRVVANKCIDIIRQTKNQMQSLDSIEFELKASAPDPLDEVVIAEGYHRLIAAIEDLDEGYKATLKYKLIDGLSDSEIAALLGISAKNVNVRTFRAKKKLREALGKAGNIPPKGGTHSSVCVATSRPRTIKSA